MWCIRHAQSVHIAADTLTSEDGCLRRGSMTSWHAHTRQAYRHSVASLGESVWPFTVLTRAKQTVTSEHPSSHSSVSPVQVQAFQQGECVADKTWPAANRLAAVGGV